MKKILTILLAFLGVGFVFCFILGMCIPVDVSIPEKSAFVYRLCNGTEYFLKILPTMLLAGILISFSVHFGHNSEKSNKRFSLAMANRYKQVMITALISTFVLSLANETLGILVSQKKENIVNRPKIIKEYIDVGNMLYENGLYDRSLTYANGALNLDPNSSSARDLKSRVEMEINREYLRDLRFDLENAQPLKVEDNSTIIDKKMIYDANQYLLKSLEAVSKEQWFDAHYFAEMGIKLASSKDPNVDRLKEVSALAWNNLTELQNTLKSKDEKIFDQKYKGYLALMEGDELQAYYIFRYLDETYPELKRDKDIQFYFEEAKKKVEEKYFFIDETLELETFETANDVYFSYQRIDGTVDILYFKGMTMIKATGQSIQYLRDFTIVTLKNGEWFRTMHVPYAKVMPVSVKSLNVATKAMLEISDKTDYVPYILLKSIDRNNQNLISTPLYTYASGEEASTPEYMLYPMPYSDFLLLEEATGKPQDLPLHTLFTLSDKAAKFGYSSLAFTNALPNRLLFPLYILILLIVVAICAWNYRIGSTLYFRMSWVFCFPLIIGIMYLFYKLAIFLFKLLNFAIAGIWGSGALIAGIVFYVLLLIAVSICFMSRKVE